MSTTHEYYVTLRRDRRVSALLGPYESHKEALDNVDRGHRLAIEADPWAAVDSIGTAKAPAGSVSVFGR